MSGGKAILGLLLLLIAITFGLTWCEASQEARVFNSCTGSKVTTWDAMWADFRIVECEKQ